MATINKKLIHFNLRTEFEKRKAAGDILESSICWIKDAKLIYTHGTYYDCSTLDLSNFVTTDSLMSALASYALTTDLATKQDAITDLAAIRSGASKGATALQSIPSEYVTETELNEKGYLTEHQDISGKQDVISDLATIRSGAAKGATALQSVPSEYITETELATELGKKQNTISDLATIRSNAAKGATALQSVPSEYVTETELSNKGYATTASVNSSLGNKVDKVSGKQLSTEDFTTALKTKLQGLSNYDDTAVNNAINSLRTDFNALVSGDTTTAIKTFNEIIAFLDGVTDTQTLEGIIASIQQQIATKQDIISDLATIRAGAAKGATAIQSHQDISGKLDKTEAATTYLAKKDAATVATSGSYNDLSNKPTIPAAVTETTVANWGFTKNTGTYSKPSGGIPKTDLASAVQTSLGKADTAMQALNGNFYGVCNSDADTYAKVVTINGFPSTLTVGQRVTVKFTYASSNTDADNPMTLNVNGTGAYTIYRYGTTLADNGTTTSGWVANSIQNFTFDGTGWMRDYWNNTTYSNVSLGQGYATCSTAESTTAKTASLSSYSLTTGGIVSVKFSNAVPASATLNINSKGAKSIYHKGAAIKAGVIKAGDVATFIYSSQYHLISVDRGMTTVTTSAEGLMSASDKTKLDGIATGATAVSESTVSGWGFTKNTGTYSKPSTGIPKTDLASAVQTSLGKADTALQSYTEQYKGTVTGVKINGTTKNPSSGVVDLGTVLTAHQDISGKADKSSLATVATSGSYNDLSNKPTIPSAVTETTVSGWGFTKNSGTITKVQANGTDVASSGTANIPAASTSAYGVTKLSSATNSTSTSLAATASAVKAAYDLANGKQNKLTSGTNIKTVNNTSLLGSGNIAISPAYSLVSKGTSGTTATLSPNTFYVWGTVSSLTLTFGTEVSGVANEYLFQFTSGTTATTLSLPSTVKWVGGEAPAIEAGKTYQISILNNFATLLAF